MLKNIESYKWYSTYRILYYYYLLDTGCKPGGKCVRLGKVIIQPDDVDRQKCVKKCYHRNQNGSVLATIKKLRQKCTRHLTINYMLTDIHNINFH